MVHPKVRQAVCEESSRGSNALGGEVNRTHGEGKSNVAKGNKGCLRWGENVGSRVQMALFVIRRRLAVALSQTLHASTGVHQDVGGPAENLVENKSTNGDNWRVGGSVIHDLLQNGRLSRLGVDIRLAVRDENGVLLHVVMVAMMTCVAELPAEKRNHQHAVQEPASHGVDGEVVGEGIMAAVVGENPEASEEASLDEAVKCPEGHGDEQRSIQLRKLDGGIEERAHDDEIANHVRKGANHRALEAFGWNGIL